MPQLVLAKSGVSKVQARPKCIQSYVVLQRIEGFTEVGTIGATATGCVAAGVATVTAGGATASENFRNGTFSKGSAVDMFRSSETKALNDERSVCESPR